MASQSRRQRRAIAKQMGYLGRNETVSDLLQRTRRSGDFGKQLHTLHLEKVMNDQLEVERTKRKFSEEAEIELSKFGYTKEESALQLNSDAFTFLKDNNTSGPEASPSDLGQEQNNV